jgi:hypothetical protein
LIDTEVETLEQAQEKLQQAIELGAHDETDYWRDWIKGYGEGELKKAREMALKEIESFSRISGRNDKQVHRSLRIVDKNLY